MIAHILRKFCRPAQLHFELKDFAVAQMDVAPRGIAQIEHGPDQSAKNGLKIECRAADRLQHVCGRRLLLQRVGEIARSRLHLVEQARVFDRDDGLVGEGLDKFNLTLRKPAWLSKRQRQSAFDAGFPQQWNAQKRARDIAVRRHRNRIFRIVAKIGNFLDMAGEQDARGDRSAPGPYFKRRKVALERLAVAGPRATPIAEYVAVADANRA